MTEWLAFLRAINLGPTRKFPKADIVTATLAVGATDVATHINTGNVYCRHPEVDRSVFEAQLQRVYSESAGFDIPVVAFTVDEFRALAHEAEEITAPDLDRHYIYLLKEEPTAEAVASLQETAGDAVVVRGRAAHLLYPKGTHQMGVVDPYKVEKRLGVVATNRNLNVIRTIAQKWC